MTTKRQHFVQQHYLEAWANDDGLLAALRLGDIPKLQSPKNTAVINRLYSLAVPTLEECGRIKAQCVNEQLPRDFVKLLFCVCYYPAIRYQLESEQRSQSAREVSDFLIDEHLLPDEQDVELRELLKEGRKCTHNSNTLSKVVEGLEPFIARIEQSFNRTLDLLRENPKVGSIGDMHHLINYLALQKVRTPAFLNANSTKGMADMLMGAFGYVRDISSNIGDYMGKIFELANDLEFITSDNPVIDFAPKLQGISLLPQIFYPLTPKTCFMLYTSPVSMTPEQVQLWNDRIFEESYNEVYATNTAVLERYIRSDGIKLG